jgi:hypothetical protein
VSSRTIWFDESLLHQINLFEYEKVEQDTGPAVLRDYRLTNNTAILNTFKTNLSAMQTRFVWASVGGSGSGTGNSSSAAGSAASPVTSGGSGGLRANPLTSSALALTVMLIVLVATTTMGP